MTRSYRKRGFDTSHWHLQAALLSDAARSAGVCPVYGRKLRGRGKVGETYPVGDVYGDSDVVLRRGHYPFREAQGEVSGATKMLPAFEANREAMDQALAGDPTVFLLGEDIGEPAGGLYKTTDGLQAKYGKHRVRNTPTPARFPLKPSRLKLLAPKTFVAANKYGYRLRYPARRPADGIWSRRPEVGSSQHR